MFLSRQQRLNEVLDADLAHPLPAAVLRRVLTEEGFEQLVEPYLRWRWWARHAESVNGYRRLRARLHPRRVITALGVLVVAGAVAGAHLNADISLALNSAPLLAAALLLGLLARRVALAVELRLSNDELLVRQRHFTAANGERYELPLALLRAMSTTGAGSRAFRTQFSIHLRDFFPQRSVVNRQERLDWVLRKPRHVRWLRKVQQTHQLNAPNKEPLGTQSATTTQGGTE